jgi:glycosyltransferase involved in cell wall biosynthesis
VDETDTNLSFFLDWLREIASRVPVVHVAAWKVGAHQLPQNVHVHAMPKGKLKRIIALKKLTFSVRKDVDTVFVHMLAPVAAALGFFWRLMGKRVVLWYTHGSVPASLRVANVFVNGICTATSPSMNLRTIKKIVTGHGIDTGFYNPNRVRILGGRKPILVTVGRISARKRIEDLFDLCEKIQKTDTDLAFKLYIVGDPYLEKDFEYKKYLEEEISRRNLQDVVVFVRALLTDALLFSYVEAALFVTASQTGSLDKVVLESMACETAVLARSKAFEGFVGARIAGSEWTEADVRYAIERLRSPRPMPEARIDVETKASLKTLISRLVSILLD